MQLGDPLLTGVPIPPAERESHYEYSCPSVCTATWSHSISVFADFLHMNKLGKRSYSMIRTASNLAGFLNNAEFWDYNYQQFTLLPKIVNITAGDRINTHCLYDSSTRDTSTKVNQNI